MCNPIGNNILEELAFGLSSLYNTGSVRSDSVAKNVQHAILHFRTAMLVSENNFKELQVIQRESSKILYAAIECENKNLVLQLNSLCEKISNLLTKQ